MLPARFEHDRVLLEANAPDGSTVRFYTDSGGGFNAIGAEAAKRLGLPYVGDLDGDDGKPLRLLGFTPALAAQVPPPLPEEDRAQAGRLIQSELAAGDGGVPPEAEGGAEALPARDDRPCLGQQPAGIGSERREPLGLLVEERVQLGLHRGAEGRRVPRLVCHVRHTSSRL